MWKMGLNANEVTTEYNPWNLLLLFLSFCISMFNYLKQWSRQSCRPVLKLSHFLQLCLNLKICSFQCTFQFQQQRSNNCRIRRMLCKIALQSISDWHVVLLQKWWAVLPQIYIILLNSLPQLSWITILAPR